MHKEGAKTYCISADIYIIFRALNNILLLINMIHRYCQWSFGVPIYITEMPSHYSIASPY